MTWGDRVTFEVSSADPDDTPVWVDLTSFALHAGGFELSTGRQNNLDQSEPSTLRFTLRNDDDRFTYANPFSPYAAWWGPGRKCRLRETYGSTVVDLFTGYLQVPEESQPDAKASGQQVTVSAIDRLGRLAAAPTFVSTLGAHIVGSARNGILRGYWPLNDPGPGTKIAPAVGNRTGDIFDSGSTITPTTQLPEVNFQGGGHPPGDDVDSLQFVYGLAGVLNVGFNYAYWNYGQAEADFIEMTTGQVATLVGWVNMASTTNITLDSIGISVVTRPSLGAWFVTTTRVADTAGKHWNVEYYNGSAWDVAAANGSSNATERWYALAIRWGFDPNVLELWVDDARYTGTFTETVTSAAVLNIESSFNGSIAHHQIYVGDPDDFTFADFTAQRAVGLLGLERQTTGDRIRSIAAYAGIPLAEYTDTVDKGTAIMQAASLADKTPLEAMREAERTEQGLLYVDGSGRLVFRDRRSLYNI